MSMPREGCDQGFAALLAAASAIEQRQREQLVAALESVPTGVLLRAAARHRCLGYLRRNVLEMGVRTGRAREFAGALREYAGKAAVQAYATRRQLDELVNVVAAAGVPIVLLKGAARLWRGEPEAQCNTMYDLDLLICAHDAPRALAALGLAGYRANDGLRSAGRYWLNHHHLIPLVPSDPGLSVELHTQLAPRGMLSMPTDWNACRRYLKPLREGAPLYAFDRLGTAVHLVIHGAGLRRLHDVVMLASILRAAPSTYEQLIAAFAAERWQPVALQSVAIAAARVAGMTVPQSQQVERCLAWIMRREGLAPYVRDRSQFVDAWFSNGGTLWGAATRQALPIDDRTENAVVASARFAYRLCGRIVTSAVAAATRG